MKDNIKDFIEANYNSNRDFLMMCCRAMTLVPLDAFGQLKYTYGHLALGRQKYLVEGEKEDLVGLGFLWDVSKMLSSFSLLEIDRTDAFAELQEIFKLQKATQADLTPILSFDSTAPKYSDTALECMRSATEHMGFYRLDFVGICNIVERYLPNEYEC